MDDKELIASILTDGKTAHYTELMRRYSGVVYSKVLRILKNEDDAKEITQRAFVKGFSHLYDWRGGKLGAWFSSIAVHLALDEVQARRKHRSYSIEEVKVQAQENKYNEEHEAQLCSLEQAIEKLSTEDRSIIKMYYTQGLKTEKIAQKLGMTQNNILVRMHRIRERLKKQINDDRKDE